MNILQSVATVFLTMALATMANKIISIDLNITQLLFVVFYMLLRVKIYLDDICYYKFLTDERSRESNDNINANFEVWMFVLGICFWFLWVITIAFIKKDSINAACYILAGTILLGEIILHIIDIFSSSPTVIGKCKIWPVANWLYIGFLGLSAYTNDEYKAICLLGGIIAIFIDVRKSNTVHNVIYVLGLPPKKK